MKRIVLCDDVQVERQIIKDALERFFLERSENIIIQEYDCGETFLADVEEGFTEFDMLFLDIRMEKVDGMETARRLRKRGIDGPVVFLTNSPDYAVDSYEVHAAGYLLKPLKEEKLKSLLERLLKPDVRRRIAVRTKGRMRYFYIDEILWVESDKHTVTLHFTDGNCVAVNDRLTVIEEQIGDRRFLRCHQSYLVNMDYVADVQEDFILTDRTRIPLRVRNRKELLDAYYSYFVQHLVDNLPKEDEICV